MGERCLTKQNKRSDQFSRKTISVSLLSGSGAALLLSVITPFQLIGRVPDIVLAGAFLGGGIGVVTFGYCCAFAINTVELAETSSPRFDELAQKTFSTLVYAAMGVLALFAVIVIGLLIHWNSKQPKPKTGMPAVVGAMSLTVPNTTIDTKALWVHRPKQ